MMPKRTGADCREQRVDTDNDGGGAEGSNRCIDFNSYCISRVSCGK